MSPIENAEVIERLRAQLARCKRMLENARIGFETAPDIVSVSRHQLEAVLAHCGDSPLDIVTLVLQPGDDAIYAYKGPRGREGIVIPYRPEDAGNEPC